MTKSSSNRALRKALLKHAQYLEDTSGDEVSVRYLRTRDGKEIDFALCRENRIVSLIEVKLTDNKPSPNLQYFHKKMPDVASLQLVQNLRQEESIAGISIVSAGAWLSSLEA